MIRKKKIFNFQYASIGFFTMGTPTFLLNLIGGTLFEAIRAGVAQGSLSFIVIGVNTAFFEFLYHKYNDLIAFILPILVTSGLSLALHLLNESPQPFLSAGFVFVSALVNFSMLIYFKRTHGTICVKHISKKVINHLRSK